MKNEVILTAQTLGFFRAKSPEKQSLILAELLDLEEFQDVPVESISKILEAEILRRHVVYTHRAKKALERVDAQAAKPLTAGVDSASSHVMMQSRGRYVVTTAQNNTDVDKVFFESLRVYCESNDATLLIAKTTYNLNGFQQSQDTVEGVYYDPLVLPYLVEGQIDLGGIEVVAQANVLPTAKNPLSGFEGVTDAGIHVIIPASKIALKCTASLKGGKGKILYATGAITKRNYILRKAGAVASTEHNIGALFVDTSGPNIITRQLELMPGSGGFYDENKFYCPTGADDGYRPMALQFGDIHAEKMESVNLEKMKGLIDKYKPEHTILHDVMDFSSRNHHNIKDCTFIFAQDVREQTVENDVRQVVKVIDALANVTHNEVHIIESNHDLAINTWLKNTDFKDDPTNALVYLRCMTALYEHIQLYGDTDFNMLEYAYREIGGGKFVDSIMFHGTDESVIMSGVEMGCHGHTGTNGSRGSPTQFRALGIPMNTGHTHTPSILGKCYTAGVSATLDMGYNIGASSWRLANILTWPNGQRQIIFM